MFIYFERAFNVALNNAKILSVYFFRMVLSVVLFRALILEKKKKIKKKEFAEAPETAVVSYLAVRASRDEG